jgi:hypothetical protein
MPSAANTSLVPWRIPGHRRYANWEITGEEYLNLRDDITRKQNA